jgi:hypothetical protein
MTADHPHVTTIDALVEWCGHHTISRTNNGYGCRHPRAARDPETGEGQCFGFSCPLATTLYPESEPLDADWLTEIGHEPGIMTDEGGWLVVDRMENQIVRLPILSGRGDR